jgi:hypothetical protein
MPLFIPVIIGGAVISVTGWGVKKGYKGITNIKDAKRTVRSAELKYNHHQQILEESRSLLNTHAHDFGVFKLQVASSTIENMLELLKELKRRGKQTPINHLAGIDFEPEQFLVEMKELTGVANELLASLVKGVAKGTLTSAALYGLAGSIGVASTGTAISVLAGAAAKSATLAWLGGGALAAGGWGMAGGTLVLGGVVAAPVFLIIGHTLEKQGQQALTKATKYVKDVETAIEKMNSTQVVLEQIKNRIDELTDVIGKLQVRADEHLGKLWNIVASWDETKKQDTTLLAEALTLCKALAELFQAPVINNGNEELNPEIPRLIAKHTKLIS